MNNISYLIIPIIVLIVTINGFIKKVNLYESFINGAKEGLSIIIAIFPYIIGMIFAVNVFLKSGFMEFAFSFLKPIINTLNIPLDILPMAILRSVSGNATLAILNDIFNNYGPDSFAGRLASTIQGCSDTTFYVITLYFGSIGVTKIKHSLKAGLFADLFGVLAAFIVSYLIFY